MAKIDATKKTTLDTNLAGSVVASSSAMKNVIDDYANVINSNSPEGRYAADAGSTDAYSITLDPVPTTYVTGMIYRFKANTANTGTCSLNVNSLGAKTIKKNASDDMETGDILADQFVEVMYDGTNMQVISVTSELKSHKAESVTDDAHGWNSATRHKVGTFTRDLTLASSSQSITGVGFQPKAIIIFASGTGAEASWGMYDGITMKTTFINDTGAFGLGTRLIRLVQSAANSQDVATASLDADGFTLDWTKAGSPTGTGNMQYIAYR